MKLQDLTDAHVRALLELDADALFYIGAIVHTPGIRWGREEWRRALLEAGTIRTDFEHGDEPLPLGLALTEAQRIADEMGRTRAEHLVMAADDSDERHTFNVVFVDMLSWDGLVESGRDDGGRYFCRATPAGRLVLALRERRETNAKG